LIVLTKTLLSVNFLDCELGLNNYKIYRFGRCSLTSKCLHAGGVLIGIRKDISSHLIKTNCLNVKQIFVNFFIGTSSYLVGGVYIIPLSSIQIYESHSSSVNNLINKYINHTIIICGDYNLPKIIWNNDDN